MTSTDPNMNYVATFEHPDTKVTVIVKFRGARLTFEVEPGQELTGITEQMIRQVLTDAPRRPNTLTVTTMIPGLLGLRGIDLDASTRIAQIVGGVNWPSFWQETPA